MPEVVATTGVNERDPSIDALRGLAMILVVVGHTLGAAFPTTYLTHPAQIILYSFHLPLFAAISGYLMHGRASNPFRIITRRFMALMVPYFSWYVVWWGVSHYRGDETNIWDGLLQVATSPLAPNSLWFLYGLFLANTVFAIVMAIKPALDSVKISLLVALLLFVSGIFEGVRLLDPKRVSWLYIFFALGYLCAGPWRIRRERIYSVSAWSTLLYAGSLCMIWTVRPDGTRTINLLLGESAYVNVLTRVFLVIAAASACALLWILFHRAPVAVQKPLGFVGVRSTGVYAMHKRLIFLTLELGASGFWIPFAVALSGSTLLTLILERIPFVSNVFLGRDRLGG